MEPQRDRDGYWRSLSESINKIAEDYRLSSTELAQSAIAFHRAAQQLLELRKNAPRLNKGDSVTLWLYESGQYGTRGIIGKCRLVVTAGLRPYPPKGILEWTMNQACVTEEHLRNYLPCYVWGVQDPVRISTVPLSDIGMTRPPQSWQYLTDEQADILERRLA